jgi:hypothetical protein
MSDIIKKLIGTKKPGERGSPGKGPSGGVRFRVSQDTAFICGDTRPDQAWI